MSWLLSNWKLIAAGLILAALGVQTYRVRDISADFQAYRLEREAQDRENMVEAARKKQFDEMNRRRTDEEYAAALRRARAASVRVEPAPTETITPAPDAGGGDGELACFDRRVANAELTGVLERAAERLTAIARQGEEVAAALRACQAWGRDVGSPSPGDAPSSAPDGSPALSQ